jgi:hypothetical protein
MITFAELGQLGRLGNQLFQYAALKSLGLTKGYEVKIPNYKTAKWHGQECLLDNFSLECDFLESEDVARPLYFFEEKFHPDMRYDHRFLTCPDNANLTGYFQNLNYFKNHEEQIKREFTLSNDLELKAEEEILRLKKDNNCEIVSLHIRRGDLTDGSCIGTNIFYGPKDILTEDSVYGGYLKKAKNIFHNKKVKFLIFSGGSRNGDYNTSDLDWCKKNFTGNEYLFSEDKNTMEDFSLLKSCDHNIACHMTSFGWWAAYLNSNKDKVVVAPKHYDITDQTLIRKDFYPPDWKLI